MDLKVIAEPMDVAMVREVASVVEVIRAEVAVKEIKVVVLSAEDGYVEAVMWDVYGSLRRAHHHLLHLHLLRQRPLPRQTPPQNLLRAVASPATTLIAPQKMKRILKVRAVLVSLATARMMTVKAS